MRIPTDIPRRRQRRGLRNRVAIIATVVVVIILILSAKGIAGFYTDYLWFDSLGIHEVFVGILGAKVFLAVAFMLIMFVLVLVNLIVADRIAPPFGLAGPQDELVQRYREVVGRHGGKVRVAAAVLFALILGAGQSSQWNSWILFRNAVSFGVKDPQFHKDVGFFVFRLPFLQFLVSWSFAAVVVTVFLVAVFDYLNGGIRLQAPGQRVTPQVKAHLSVLLGILALIKAAGYFLQQYELDFSTRGVVRGATYTDVHAQLPAIRLLILIMILAFGLFIANIYLKGWTLPILGVGLWLLVSVVVGAIYPALVQQLKVKPSENQRELPYIARNIAATRSALGIANVDVHSFAYNESLTPQDIMANANTIRNVRLWDPALTLQTFTQLQELRQYYQFNDEDIDRYVLDSAETQTVLSVRELNQSDLPQNTWVNRHLQFTHGYGATLAPANAVTPDGRPVFAVQDIPPSSPAGAPAGTPAITQPDVYFGENMPNFSIVDSKQGEVDFQRPDGSIQYSHYAGKDGVKLSSFLRRLAYTIRFGDKNILLSGQITSHSRIVYTRDIQDRVHKAAPFLKLDADPYAAVVDGRLVWIQDAYTVTDRYPYGQEPDVSRLSGASGLKTGFDYVRNSVKAVIDAYNGTTTLYVMDPADPILRAYERAFPKLFKPRSAMPADLVVHLRYPEDLFKVQTTAYGRYHIIDPSQFYASSDAWNVAQNPGVGRADQLAATTPQTTPSGQVIPGSGGQARQDPFYLVMRLPAEKSEEFQLIQPMVPQSTNDKQQNLAGFLVAKSDPGDYGKLEAYKMPEGVLVSGPAQVDARMEQDPTVSRDITLLNTNNSEADLGNILMIPINQSLLYIRPLYVKSTRNPIPEFKKAIVVYGTQVAYADTLQEALSQIFPGIGPLTQEQAAANAPSAPAAAPPTSSGANVASAAQLLQQAQADFSAAQTALRNGDLATYQQQNNAGDALTAQALAQLQGSPPSAAGSGTATSSPSTTGPPPSSA